MLVDDNENMKKYTIYLLSLGIFLISAGIVIGQFNPSLSNVVIGIIGSGGALIIASGVIFLYINKGFWGKRSIEAGTNAVISTVALLLILALVNFLGLRYSLKLDLTETKLYTLSPQSQQLVKNLSQPLTVYVFDSPANTFDRNLLKDYARINDRFQFQFVNPNVNINIAQKFGVTNFGDVYLEYGDKQQLVQTLSPENRLSESKLTNAIAKIQQTEQPIVYILQGHGEPSMEEGQNSISQGVKMLTDKGYQVHPLTLATSPLIPPDADVVIIANPEKELLEGEIKILEKYMAEGGNLLVMYNAGTTVNIDRLLSPWGVKYDDRLVVDASGTGEVFGLGPSITIVVKYGQHPITQDFQNNLTLFPWARAVIYDTIDGITTTPLLISNSQSWGEKNTEGKDVEFNEGVDLPAPLNIGVALAKKNPLSSTSNKLEKEIGSHKDKSEQKQESKPLEANQEGETNLPLPPTVKTPKPSKENLITKNQPSEMRMVMIGNANFITDGWIQQQVNGDLFVNTVAWLGHQDNASLSISPKSVTNRRINLNNFQASLITWLALIIIPALAFITATVTWWQRSR